MTEPKPARRAPDRLSSSDMSSLLAERGPIHVHVGATLVVQGKPPEFDDLLGHVQRRLSLVSDMDSLAADLALAVDEQIRAAGLRPKRTAWPAK